MRPFLTKTLEWALALDPATLKWPAAVLVALCFGLVLFGLVQYQAFNRDWGLHLVLGLAGGAVVAGLGGAIHWLLGVFYGVGYVLAWLVWVLTRRWRWWRRALARGLTAGLSLGPLLWVGATEKAMLGWRGGAAAMAKWLVAPNGLMWFWMMLGAVWLLVLVGGWGCWRSAPGAKLSVWRVWLLAVWGLASVWGLNWYVAGRVDLWAASEEAQHWRLGYVLVSRPGSQWYRDADGATPLHWAAENGNATPIRLLLPAGADVQARANDGGTPLHRAAENGNATALRLLLAAGADVHAKTNAGWLPLHLAAEAGSAAALRLLLEAGAEVNAKGDFGWTPLHVAAWQGKTAALRPLLAAGADVNANANTNASETPLHWAAMWCEADGLHLLLAAGADVHATADDGSTPLHWAAENGKAAALRILLAAGARVNERDAEGATALDLTEDDECRHVLRQAGGKTSAELDAEQAKPPPPAPVEPKP